MQTSYGYGSIMEWIMGKVCFYFLVIFFLGMATRQAKTITTTPTIRVFQKLIPVYLRIKDETISHIPIPVVIQFTQVGNISFASFLP